MENLIANRIRELRKSLKLSQEEFARSIGVTQAAVSYIEKGGSGISIEVLEKISNTYKITLDWLVKGIGSAPITKKFIEDRLSDLEKATTILFKMNMVKGENKKAQNDEAEAMYEYLLNLNPNLAPPAMKIIENKSKKDKD